jgi:hypothetical protein
MSSGFESWKTFPQLPQPGKHDEYRGMVSPCFAAFALLILAIPQQKNLVAQSYRIGCKNCTKAVNAQVRPLLQERKLALIP